MIAIAEKFGQLPETIEANMTEFWFRRVVVQMDAEALERQRVRDENDQQMKARR